MWAFHEEIVFVMEEKLTHTYDITLRLQCTEAGALDPEFVETLEKLRGISTEELTELLRGTVRGAFKASLSARRVFEGKCALPEGGIALDTIKGNFYPKLVDGKLKRVFVADHRQFEICNDCGRVLDCESGTLCCACDIPEED